VVIKEQQSTPLVVQVKLRLIKVSLF